MSILSKYAYARSFIIIYPYIFNADPCVTGVTFNDAKFPYNIRDVRWALTLAIDIVDFLKIGYDGATVMAALHIPPTPAYTKWYYKPLEEWLKNFELDIGNGEKFKPFDPNAPIRLAEEMRKRGYHLEGEVPETSKELADTILGKKAIPEFRWTPISEVVKNGGAADLLDIEEYLRWFEEIPEEKRREIIETWGDPYSLLKEETSQDEEKKKWTKLSLGLYQGKIVIPGLKWGNVFLCIQPKRGCAGARCDGQVCKILHDPNCPPPHQWIAVYKWIDKVFKADIIVHVGTHGYLEFLPGKGCGLSPLCYPQISIGTIPHLYIYNIDNPMEGITAKRRSYATIIDHLTPVMKPTETYGELDQLEELLDQYQKAKTTNDKARLQVIFRSIEEKAKDLDIKGTIDF